MTNYVSLFNETTGDFDSVNIISANITSATIDTATVSNAIIINENVTNSIIQYLNIGNKLSLPDGTYTNPSLTFTNENQLGFYRSNNGEITFVCNNLPIFRINTNGTYVFSNLYSDYKLILSDLSADQDLPTITFFDVGLGIFRSNPNTISFVSESYKIIDIDSLSLSVHGLLNADNCNISGTSTLNILNATGSSTLNTLNVTGTSSFTSTITCHDIIGEDINCQDITSQDIHCENIYSQDIDTGTYSIISSNFAVTPSSYTDPITLYTSPTIPTLPTPGGAVFGNKYYISKTLVISRIKYNYALYGGGTVGVWDDFQNLLYSYTFTGSEPITGAFRYKDVPILVKPSNFVVAAITAAPNYLFPAGGFGGCTINSSLITSCSFVADGPTTVLIYPASTSLANNTAGVLVGCDVSSEPLLNATGLFMPTGNLTCATINNGTNSLTTGAINCTSITNTGTLSSTSSATIGSLTTTSLQNNGTFSNTSSATMGSLSTTSINNSGTFSNTSAATMGALTSTSINNSGTLSSGTTSITGTLTCSSAARVNVVGPNTNSTNSLDVYGLLGMSLANANTFYGINAYYSGGWRPIRNGYSCYYKLDGGGGGISIQQTNSSGTADSLVTMNPMLDILTNGAIVVYGFIASPACYLSAQPMMSREMTTTQSITNNSATTITSWTNAIVNQGSGIAYSGGIFTLTAGTYSLSYQIKFDSNATGRRESWIVHTTSGRLYAGVTTNATSARMLLSGSCTIKCATNDQIVLNVYQDSGGSLNVDPATDSCTFTVLRLH